MQCAKQQLVLDQAVNLVASSRMKGVSFNWLSDALCHPCVSECAPVGSAHLRVVGLC